MNGNQIGELVPLHWNVLTPFSVPLGSPLLNPGQNEVTISITGTDNYLEGVRLEGSVSVVPEPCGIYADCWSSRAAREY